MRLPVIANLILRPLFTLALLAMLAAPTFAQFGGGGGGGGLGGGGGNQGGTEGASGVAVDANGVLRTIQADPTGQLARQRVLEARGRLEGDLAKPAKLRKVSLTRLEKVLKQKLDAGSGPDDVMKNLAGLTRIDYVMCYPDSGDIVLAGPAEPWAADPAGRVRGIESGQPTVELQDLIAALRCFPPGAKQDSPLIYCSIDPTQEGLTRFQQFLSQVKFQRPPNQQETQFFVQQLGEKLGLQKITVGGISPKTHFAQVLVEADYRMKLIGIGLERPPVRLKSYVDRANPAMVSRNAMQRWYFVPDYERLAVSEDGLAMQIVGEGVKLIGEDEMVGRDGTRKSSGRSNRASNAFTGAFTKVYSRLAERAPVYAQLRNCIDLAVAAAFMQDRNYYSEVDWRADTFNSEEAFAVETYNPPQQVATAVNSMWKGSSLMTPVGGGVEIRPSEALQSVNLLKDDKGEIAAQRGEIDLSTLDANQWWWD